MGVGVRDDDDDEGAKKLKIKFTNTFLFFCFFSLGPSCAVMRKLLFPLVYNEFYLAIFFIWRIDGF